MLPNKTNLETGFNINKITGSQGSSQITGKFGDVITADYMMTIDSHTSKELPKMQ